MKTILASTFSINMLRGRATVQFRPLSLQVLGFEVPVNEIAIQLDFGMRLLVGKYRITEIQWWLVTRGATGA